MIQILRKIGRGLVWTFFKIKATLITHDWVWSIAAGITIFAYYNKYQEDYTGDPSYTFQFINKAFVIVPIILVFHGLVIGFLSVNHGHAFNRYDKNEFDYEKIPEWLKYIYIPALYFLMLLVLVTLFMGV